MPKKQTTGKKKEDKRPFISDHDRAEILLQKELTRQTGKTQVDIAKDFKVSQSFVAHLYKEDQTDEVISLYEKKREKLAAAALEVTLKALEKSGSLIDLADDPKHLSGIAAAGRFSDSVYRLETGQPTTIAMNMDAEAHALDFIKLLMARMDRPAALDHFKRANLEPLIPDHRKSEILAKIEEGTLRLLPA